MWIICRLTRRNRSRHRRENRPVCRNKGPRINGVVNLLPINRYHLDQIVTASGEMLVDERARLRLEEDMVGWLFHKVQTGIEEIRQGFFQAKKPDPLPRLRLPFGWWAAYAVVAWLVWANWPVNKELPTEVWLAVLSFEGVLAALLASVGQAITFQAVLPSTIAFWSALDSTIGRQLAEAVRRMRDDPTEATSSTPFKNAFVVSLNTLFLLPLVVVLDSRWSAAILAASLIWTVRRMTDAFAFFLPGWATVLPRMYWRARSWHESLAYCPVCKDRPQPVAWPPPLGGSEPESYPEECLPVGNHKSHLTRDD